MMNRRLLNLRATRRSLRADTSGLALLEFAFSLPILLLLSLTGAEITNYIITRMRVSQLALHLADNAARIGTGSQLQAKTINEVDINDLFTGAGLQAGELELFARGRVILSSLEPDPANAGKYRIRWQRCRGAKAAQVSAYGGGGTVNLAGMGKSSSRLITAPANGVTMYIEVYYEYKPIFKAGIAPNSSFREEASMMVRDRRETSDDTRLPNGSVNPDPKHRDGVYRVDGVTAASCGT